MEPVNASGHAVSPTVNRSLTALALRQLSPDNRLVLDELTYVIRESERFVAYRQWLGAVGLIETFSLSDVMPLLDWLEQHGYAFETSVLPQTGDGMEVKG
jgi:hypothetical protein